MASVYDKVRSVNSREDLIAFVRALRDDFKDNPQEWENDTLAFYLDAMAAWIEDMDGVYKNIGEQPPTEPSWQVVAKILLAAKAYE